MLFNSWSFVALFVVTSCAYFAFPEIRATSRFAEKFQMAVLIVSSFVFYGAGDPRLIALLAFSVLGNAVAASMLLQTSDQQRRRIITRVAVVGNLLLLAFFKYAALLVGSVLPASLEGGLIPVLRDIPLPIGISFYTFQGISLIVDLQRKNEVTTQTLQKNLEAGFGNFAARITLYIAFFPQLVAGPIVQAHDFVAQISVKRFRDVDLDLAVRAMVVGAFLKMVVADNIKEETALLTNVQFQGSTKLELVLLAVGYSAQIFADFAGYSLLAIGLAAFLGYDLPQNFNYPYISASITEFWRRWHISLSSWLRDYLYIPLGGNRAGAARTYRNLFLVMTFGGLWHGASWNFAVWGFAHGIILAIERLVSGGQPSAPRNAATHVFRVGATFTAVTALWLLFALPDFNATLSYFQQLATAPVGSPGSVAPQALFTITLFTLPVFLYHLYGAGIQIPTNRLPLHRFRLPAGGLTLARPAVIGVLLFFIITNSGTPGEFIYFQF